MNKKAFIWDLDGTLLDSYEIIVSSLKETINEMGIFVDSEEIAKHVIEHSVSSFMERILPKANKSSEEIKKRYSEISSARTMNIKAMPNAAELLHNLCDLQVLNFVYTHRGRSTEAVLENIGIKQYFKEIVTSQSGFPRKPDPDAINYLVHKYKLDKDSTFYVGDRSIDIDCAKNAGIKSILFLPENSYGKKTGYEDFVVKNLLEIKNIVE
jgi:HAD superfamily hydrolase (TIGR01549 family)